MIFREKLETHIFHYGMTHYKDMCQALTCKANVLSQSINQMVQVKFMPFRKKKL